MKKNFLSIFAISSVLLLSGCDDANNLSDSDSTQDLNEYLTQDLNEYLTENKPKYSTEELLGKTIAEYELFLKEQEQRETEKKVSSQPKKFKNNGFLELAWEDLVTPGYDADSILEKYAPQIETLAHNSEQALALYEVMNEEFNNAPANPELADKKVSIPGFIAPIELVDGLITEFLLVPYFGACIHLPPPPSNQTLYVKVAPDYAIRNEDSYEPIWVSGNLEVDKAETDIGSASYQIQNALISKYQ